MAAKDKNKAEETKTEAIVPEAPAGALAVGDFDYGEDAGAGFEGVTSNDLTVAFIKQLQPLSPEVAEGKVPDAKNGMFIDTSTNQLYGMEQGVNFVPIGKRVSYIEWVPRKQGGGYVAQHDLTSPFALEVIKRNNGKRYGAIPVTPGDEKSNELIEHHDVFVMLLTDDGKTPTGDCAVISFTSAKIKACKDFYTKMYKLKPHGLKPGQPPPKPTLWTYRAKMVGYKDPDTSQGHFWNIRIEPLVAYPERLEAFKGSQWAACRIGKQSESELYETAKALAEMYEKGQMKANYESQTSDGVAAGGGNEVPF
jgi:hypothetical protein